MLGQTNLLVTKRWVARIPGCERECKVLNTMRWKDNGRNGWGVPVEMSQTIDWSESGSANGLSLRDESASHFLRSGSDFCSSAIS